MTSYSLSSMLSYLLSLLASLSISRLSRGLNPTADFGGTPVAMMSSYSLCISSMRPACRYYQACTNVSLAAVKNHTRRDDCEPRTHPR